MDRLQACTRFSPVGIPEGKLAAKMDCEGPEQEDHLEGSRSQGEPWRSGITSAKRVDVKRQAGPKSIEENKTSV